jgi:hypothetical protein
MSQGLLDHIEGEVDFIFSLTDGYKILLDIQQFVYVLLPIIHFFDENVSLRSLQVRADTI